MPVIWLPTGHPILPVHPSLLDPSKPSTPQIFPIPPISPSLPRPPCPPSELLRHCSGAGGNPFASLEITPALVHQLSWPSSCLARLASAVGSLSNHCIPYIISCHICIQFSYVQVQCLFSQQHKYIHTSQNTYGTRLIRISFGIFPG